MTTIRHYGWPIAFLVIGVMAFMMALATAFASNVKADYNRGCERIGWGFLMSGYRTICDGPKRADGSWDRTRREWTPEHYVRPYCYYGCSGGYWVNESTQRLETYPVTDATVLENEPGWLPSGTVLIH